jgi:hypothetical protein
VAPSRQFFARQLKIIAIAGVRRGGYLLFPKLSFPRKLL